MVVLQNKTLTELQSNIIKKPEKHINTFQAFLKIYGAACTKAASPTCHSACWANLHGYSNLLKRMAS